MARRRVEYSRGKNPWRLAAYHVGWMLVWVILILFRYQIYAMFGAQKISDSAIIGVWSGGIAASLFTLGGLYHHRIHMELDPAFHLWYILKPFVGAAMGGFVGLIAITFTNGLGVPHPWIVVILLSAYGGMREAWAMRLFKQFTTKMVQSHGDSGKTGAAPPAH